MANIFRDDGTVIPWSGEISGPTQVLDPMGQPSGWSEFETQLSPNGELCQVIVHVQDRDLRVLPGQTEADRAELARRCAARFIERRWETSRHKLPEKKEYFSLTGEELFGLRELLRCSREKLICTVHIPVKGGAPDVREIEVYDPSNAVPMLKNRLTNNTSYNWSLAKVVHVKPKSEDQMIGANL